MKNIENVGLFGNMSRTQIVERHLEKLNAIMLWLARYDWSVLALLSALVRVDASNVRPILHKLVSIGLLKTELLATGYRVYGLSESGIAHVDKINPELADVARVFQPGRIALSTFAHQYNVQVAELSLSVFGWHDFAAGRELYEYRASQIPDLVACDDNELVAAIEVELNLKSSQRMKVVCQNYSKLVDAERDPCIPYNRVLFLTPYRKRLIKMLDDYVPAEKRCLFEVDELYPVPLLLTPRRTRGGGK